MKDRIDKTVRIIFIAVSLLILASTIIYTFYGYFFTRNLNTKKYTEKYSFIIKEGANFDSIVTMLSNDSALNDINSFMTVAKAKDYPENIKIGRYIIYGGMTNNDIVSLLMRGEQTPLMVTYNNVKNIYRLAQKIGSQIQADSASIIDTYNDDGFIRSLGLAPEHRYMLILPDSYEFYWTTSAKGFWSRMKAEYDAFWNKKRTQALETIRLSKSEVLTLASIVEMETNKKSEMKTIAGVYMNRLHKNVLLQADPTLVYISDFKGRRVTNNLKKIDSPYNTYIYKGLPPGPICFPSKAAIDAVLWYEHHTYMFFCAKDDFSGYHAFAHTYLQHLRNARAYQRALNERGIW